MARKTHNEAAETLQEIEETMDRLALWLVRNRVPVILVVVIALGSALAYDRHKAWSQESRDAASSALAEVRGDYMEAMGADRGAAVFNEPANPETARQIREEYVTKFEAVGQEFAGSTAAAMALLDAGTIYSDLEQPEQALASWRAAVDSSAKGSALRAIVLTRLAQALEDAKQWGEAGDAHEQAGRIEANPIRFRALGAAARCFAEAGDESRAVEIWEEVQLADAGDQLPTHTEARLRELEARAEAKL